MIVSKKVTLLAAAIAGLLTVSSAAAVIMLDIGSTTSIVQAGWVRMCDYNDFAHAPNGTYLGPVDLGGGVTAGFSNKFDIGIYDRGAAAITASPLHALGLDDLLRDFVVFPTVGKNMQVKGLAPGSYYVTLYATDATSLTEGAKHLFVNGTDVVVGPATSSPTLAQISTTVDVTIDATGILNIGRGTGTSTAKINAVVITPTPEPGSLLLMLGGLGVGMIRRRMVP